MPSARGASVQRALVVASMLAVAGGLVVHGTWSALPAARFGESLLLAALWAVAALAVQRMRRMPMAFAIAGVAIVALIVMAGPLPVLAVAGLLLVALACGSLLVPAAVPATVVGLALVAGTLGWLLPWPVHRVWVYAPVGVAIVLLRRRAVAASLAQAMRDMRDAVDAAPHAAAWAVLALALASTGAWLPTLQYDDLAYHLGLPSQLLRHARYAPDVAQQVWSLAPWAGDVVQGIAEVLAGTEARGAVDAAWLACAAALVGAVTTRLGGGPAARWLAVALFATLPPVAALAGGMQTELPAATAMLALVACALAPRTPRLPLAVGALFGLLVGLKLMHPVAGAAAGAWAFAHAARGARPSAALGGVALALLVGGSSYVQAWTVCGNPVLPLLNGVFHSPCFAPVDFADPRWQALPGLPVPWSMTFLTGRHLEAYDGGLGFLLVGLAGALLAALASPRTRAAAVVALVAILVPMTALAYARYVVPGIVLMIPPAVVAVGRVLPDRRGAALLVALCVLDLAFQANSHWMLHSGAVKRALAAAGRDAPLFARYAPERLALARLPRDAIVLDLGGAAHAELAGRGRTTAWYAPRLNAAAAAADADPSGVAWAALLRLQHVDVVLLRAPDASPARRAGLAGAGAHLLLTEGPVECWALPTPPTR